MAESKGMIYVFEGNGKGKTSAALGVAVRMLLLGKKVVWISWFKEESWKTAEMNLPKVFENNLRMYWMGKGFYGGPLDKDTPEEHKKSAAEALNLARMILNKKEVVGGIEPDLLVLDEIVKAENEELLKLSDILDLIKRRGKTHLILTGHKAPKILVDEADLVTQMKKIKHPYDRGILAVRGLDF